jgi:hypothetical protein
MAETLGSLVDKLTIKGIREQTLEKMMKGSLNYLTQHQRDF